MSTIPTTRQTRRPVTLADGTQVFEVATQITDKGDLPFPDLFVLSITNPSSPKDDVLARIVTPLDIRQADPDAPRYVRVDSADLVTISGDAFARLTNIDELTGLPRDRTSAVRLGRSEYLSSVMIVRYSALSTADAAYRQILDRLSALVTEWRDTLSGFATNPYQDYDLPVESVSVESARTATYVAARDARVAAETARDAIAAQKTACEERDAVQKQLYDWLVTDVAFFETAKRAVQGITETVSGSTGGTPVASTNAKDFVLAQGSYSSDARSYEVLYARKLVELSVARSRLQDDQRTCDLLGANLLSAQRTVDSLRDAEREALADVYAVCPTFDPTTV